jgi:processive 1,2-diacylglycerol beta-glucosyltransferase
VTTVAPRVLVLSASIGEGHDGPARTLSAALRERGADTQTLDTLTVAGPVAQRLAGAGTQYDTRAGNVAFDVAHRVIAQSPRGQRATGRIFDALFGARLLRAVADARADVVVSTYPGASEVLGRLRADGRLRTPAVSAITDLASLRFWAHRGLDLHLLIHPESATEVREIAGPRARAVAADGLVDPRFATPPSCADARAALALRADGRLVVVSGGGWAVGDLDGAVVAACSAGAEQIVVLCGRRDDVQARLAARFAGDDAVAVWGFTDAMPTLLAAADVLVHSTAGLTVLEALMSGARVISYGWGRGHIRDNNRAYARHGLATVAGDRTALRAALDASLGRPRAAPLPAPGDHAADLVLGLV